MGHVDKPQLIPAGVATTPLHPEQFELLRDQLAAYSGVYLDMARQRVLEMGLARRLAATGETLAAYQARLQGADGPAELRLLSEQILNHETFFFRNKPHIRALQTVLLPEIQRRKPIGAPIRIWSAGCATGEEAYTLAITMLETLGTAGRACEVWATDMSAPAIAYARTGYYQGRSLGNLPPALLARYFRPSGRGYLVEDVVRAMVRFETLNLLEPFPAAAQGVDIIFCQNVMIYFQLDTCRKLLERFYTCLPAGGLLFLGFSETLWNVFDGFRSREVAGSYVYYKETFSPATAMPGKLDQPAHGRASRPLPIRSQPHTPSPPTNGRSGIAGHVTPTAVPALHHVPPGDHSRFDEAALQQGHELAAVGQLEQALDVLRQISPRSSYAAQALALVARIHADRGNLDQAVAEIRRALEVDPMLPEIYTLLGVIYGRQGEWQNAVAQHERARYLSPAAALVSFHLAEAQRQLGRTEQAAREYRATLRKLEPYPPDTLLDGVAVGWLRETCQRQVEQLGRLGRSTEGR